MPGLHHPSRTAPSVASLDVTGTMACSDAVPLAHQNLTRTIRAWRVLHAYGPLKGIYTLIDGQLAAGMHPSVVTLEGVQHLEALRRREIKDDASISLLNAWNDVRHWRKVLLDSDPAGESDIIHAHCFTAGMAGVRNFPATVYDVESWIEDSADAGGQEHSWLARSFRVAEQFVLTRAAAVVTRCPSMRDAAIQRGASAENVFVVPEAVEIDEPLFRDHEWLRKIGITDLHAFVIHAPDHAIEVADDGELTPGAKQILAAFAAVAHDIDSAYLLVRIADNAQHLLTHSAEWPKFGRRIRAVGTDDSAHAFSACDIVIAGATKPTGATTSANPSAVQAFASRRALLAADDMCNRDLSSDGRGCLWYAETDARDLATRAIFLAQNPDFRRALADAGHNYFIETRSTAAVAQQYDAVYKHAFARRKSGGLQTPAAMLTPQVAL